METRHLQRLKLTALGIIMVHLVLVVWHAAAHEVLRLAAPGARLAFVATVMTIAPVFAGLLLARFAALGGFLLLAPMGGSLLGGLGFHLLAGTDGQVASVRLLEPAFWPTVYQVTAGLLLLVEIFGVAAGWRLCRKGFEARCYAA